MTVLRITLQPTQSVKLSKLKAQMRPGLRRGLLKAGSILSLQIKKHLEGPGFTRDPGRSAPYPGVLHGALRRSVTYQLANDGMSVHIGPGGETSAYAAIHEFGGTIRQTVTAKQQKFLAAAKGIFVSVGSTLNIRIPERPYVKPALEKRKRDVINAIHREVMRGI